MPVAVRPYLSSRVRPPDNKTRFRLPELCSGRWCTAEARAMSWLKGGAPRGSDAQMPEHLPACCTELELGPWKPPYKELVDFGMGTGAVAALAQATPSEG